MVDPSKATQNNLGKKCYLPLTLLKPVRIFTTCGRRREKDKYGHYNMLMGSVATVASVVPGDFYTFTALVPLALIGLAVAVLAHQDVKKGLIDYVCSNGSIFIYSVGVVVACGFQLRFWLLSNSFFAVIIFLVPMLYGVAVYVLCLAQTCTEQSQALRLVQGARVLRDAADYGKAAGPA